MLELFKELGYVSEDEYQTLNDFRMRQNDIVHKIGGGLFFIDESEKEKIMKNAVQSVLIIDSVLERVTNQRKVES